MPHARAVVTIPAVKKRSPEKVNAGFMHPGRDRPQWIKSGHARSERERKHRGSVERRMSNTADKLRAKARQTRFLARQALNRSRAEGLHSLATSATRRSSTHFSRKMLNNQRSDLG